MRFHGRRPSLRLCQFGCCQRLVGSVVGERQSDGHGLAVWCVRLSSNGEWSSLWNSCCPASLLVVIGVGRACRA